MSKLRFISQFAFVAAAFIGSGVTGSAEWDPSAIRITLPDNIPWKDNGASATAVLMGDPDKAGWYVELTKWHPGHNSRPHFHPNDRYITVLSGTWWVGTGTKYDHSIERPVTAGSYVVHPAKGVHWDGARDADCVIEIVGMGPATATPAEQK
jgi:quercetin dioxygenase-like cupin family protein